jgi:predicted RNA-binding Zn ribbon-like protein
VKLDSYIDAGIFTSVALVNGLIDGFAGGEKASLPETGAAIRVALEIDPPSVANLTESDLPGFRALAEDLHAVFVRLSENDVDGAARIVNGLLRESPASPYLHKEDDIWRLHHHPPAAPVLPMWRAICAESLARVIGAQVFDRLGLCSASRCDRVFVDTSKNATRRYCSASCQNRTKMAAFRVRKASNLDR